jgi:hypothetical protein
MGFPDYQFFPAITPEPPVMGKLAVFIPLCFGKPQGRKASVSIAGNVYRFNWHNHLLILLWHNVIFIVKRKYDIVYRFF